MALETIEKEAANDDKAEALHLALAWLFKVYKGENQTSLTKAYMKKVLNAEGPAAAAAQRPLCSPTSCKTTPRIPMSRKPAWPDYTPCKKKPSNGCGPTAAIAILPKASPSASLANAYLAESQEIDRDPKAAKDKKKLLAAAKLKTAALKEFTDLSVSDNDYQEEAVRFLTALSIQRIGDQPVAN